MRPTAVVRRTAGVLREDLWTTGAGPRPKAGEPGYPIWRPVTLMFLVVAAAMAVVPNVNALVTGYRLGDNSALFLGLVQSAALVVALYRPVPAWWAVTLAMVVAGWSGSGRILASAPPGVPGQAMVDPGPAFPWTPAGIALQAGVLFLLALRARPRAAVEALTLSVLAGFVLTVATGPGHRIDAALGAAVLGVATLVGAALRGRHVARSELVVQEELTAGERARRTLLEERSRIARELHDVVAHHMSVISIQAQVAPHLVDSPSDALLENLAGIRENAVEALTELRRVLGVLRSEDAQGRPDAPQPTLDGLGELIDRVRGAGLVVATDVRGERRPLPPGVELSAFRIVQEALSNAMRHAPGASVRVVIAHHPGAVTIQVTNTAPGGPARPATPNGEAGHGLLGMRERTAMLGGEFACGPTRGGGYEVVATLPVDQEDDA